jgi:hypothetical protein
MQYDEFNQNKSKHSESDSSELNCAAFKARLDVVLDSHRSPHLDILLSAHAQRCPACAQWLATQMALLDSLQSLPLVEPDPDFAVRVVQTSQVHRQQQQRRRLGAMVSLAVAASLLIAMFVWRGPAQSENVADAHGARAPKISAEVLKRVDKVTQDFKPVTGSVYTALNAFWLAQRLL